MALALLSWTERWRASVTDKRARDPRRGGIGAGTSANRAIFQGLGLSVEVAGSLIGRGDGRESSTISIATGRDRHAELLEVV